jgi:hypothetical protein
VLEIRPIELKQANEFVAVLHRHHKPVTGHRFSISCWRDGRLVGVATCDRPVARMTNPLVVLEVTRLCTDGTPHACSCLYAACARAGAAIGYVKIQTFILESEPGTSLRAAGWVFDGLSGGGSWSRPSRGRADDAPLVQNQRWVKVLNQDWTNRPG